MPIFLLKKSWNFKTSPTYTKGARITIATFLVRGQRTLSSINKYDLSSRSQPDLNQQCCAQLWVIRSLLKSHQRSIKNFELRQQIFIPRCLYFGNFHFQNTFASTKMDLILLALTVQIFLEDHKYFGVMYLSLSFEVPKLCHN